jgi:hypothetical protein
VYADVQNGYAVIAAMMIAGLLFIAAWVIISKG